MMHDATGILAELRVSFDVAPSVEVRAALGREIDASHARTVPQDARRLALLLHDRSDRLVGGRVDARARRSCSSRHYGAATPGVVASTQHQDGPGPATLAPPWSVLSLTSLVTVSVA